MFSCSLTQGIDLPWESSHTLWKQELKYVWGECQCHAGRCSSFLQSWPRARELVPLSLVSKGWLLAVTESVLCFGCLCCYWHPQSAGREKEEIEHQWNGERLWWERRAYLDYRTLTGGSRKEGIHCDMANKCTKGVGAELTRSCYTVN